MDIQCLCIKDISSLLVAEGSVLGYAALSPETISSELLGTAEVLSDAIRIRDISSELTLSATLQSHLAVTASESITLEGNGYISESIKANYALGHDFEITGTLELPFTDKYAGTFGDWDCLQVLYPIDDLNVPNFAGPSGETDSLFTFIDEGVFTGDYDEQFGDSQLVSDDIASYIQPNVFHTSGEYNLWFRVSRPIIRPEHSQLRIRAAGPLTNYESNTAPRYTLSEIKFLDPSGNIIVQYEDIVFKGDADFTYEDSPNFTTYGSFPQTNNAALYSWQSGYPILDEDGIYSLSFKVTAERLDDPFTEGFDLGFEEHNDSMYFSSGSGNDYLALDGAPLSTQSNYPLNPTKGIRISAIEICNSGGLGPVVEYYVPIFTAVEPTGRRLERTILPVGMPIYPTITDIFPSSVQTIWKVNSNGAYTNQTASGVAKIIDVLNQTHLYDHITLSQTNLTDSGKLLLKFAHHPPRELRNYLYEITPGAFSSDFDEPMDGMWCTPSGAYNTMNRSVLHDAADHFFVVDSVCLRVLAKKAVGSRNYSLDVVGYSDDKLLNVTSDVGGFLQNIDGSGTIPTTSGYGPLDDLGIDGEAISDRASYYTSSGTLNDGGDHYLLSSRPIVSGTSFDWYEVPLRVYDDEVTLGKSRNYRMSSMFENLYLDIYPLPSGASIGKIELRVRYSPQNAIGLGVEGGEIRKIGDDRTEGHIYPTTRQSDVTFGANGLVQGDQIINAGPGYTPLSNISGIPHAFTTPSSIKSNYSRRWRGMEGTVQGPFDPDEFDFGFENPLLDYPFCYGYFDLDYDSGTSIVPRSGLPTSVTGTLTSTYSTHHYKNLGWRFTSGTLFNVPSYSTPYQTTDWTSLQDVSAVPLFGSHPLYGKIADAFNNVVRISGHNSRISFGDIDFNKQFGIFIRFTPDYPGSGMFSSGVLVSKWDTGKPLEFVLGYSSGYLVGAARDTGGTIHRVQDSVPYSGYQFPLNVLFTYNDNNSSGLKLYTDNELRNNWTTLRASSVAPFNLFEGTSNVIVGHSSGSGVGGNFFLAELGITSGNIVYQNPDATFKQVTAQKFLENSRAKFWQPTDTYSDDLYRLWSYVDENTQEDWNIGAFKCYQFSPDFNFLTKRTGRDLIAFNMVSDGRAYSQFTNKVRPSSVSSNVAYHTQIENDFLRFHLSDTPSNFYSAFRRITKNLPYGYKFADKSLVVETVLEHRTDNNIYWPNGQNGPKLIVSLYSKRQEPYWVPNENNWGLINRAIHYLEPSSCFMRVDSVFDYDSLTDTSESWAEFPYEPRIRDFKERYFSDDVDDMFLQYDLVYPSGPAFKSRIDIHSAHVRLENAYVQTTPNSGILNVMTSGGYPVTEYINLMLDARQYASGAFNLYTIGPIQIQNSGLPIYTSGQLIAPADLDMYIRGQSGIYNNLNIAISGSPSVPIVSQSGRLNLSIYGLAYATSEPGLAITAYNSQVSNIPDPNVVNLFTFGDSGVRMIRSNLPIFMLNSVKSPVIVDENDNQESTTLNLSAIGSTALFSRFPDGSLNLYVLNDQNADIDQQMNLTLFGNQEFEETNSSLNLFLGPGGMSWHNYNYGTDIDVSENIYASLPADDEIRGVTLIGYGACDSDSPQKAIDPPFITHDTEWREETCNEGGIFRAINTYTNLDVGYSGNYYGIRKFTGLSGNAPYFATLTIKTGSTEPINVPRQWEEWEYGIGNTADGTADIHFSGFKFIGDYPYLSGNLALNPVSGRNANDNYGTSVAMKGDMIAVGSPFRDIPDESGRTINNAGTVFLYRRNADVAGRKATYYLEQEVLLPSGYRRDYVGAIIPDAFCFETFCVDARQWAIGQHGREFGHAVDLAASGDREVMVVGAPGAAWDRQFTTINTSGIPVAMLVLTDKFDYNDLISPNSSVLSNLEEVANYWNVLYKYFSAPLPSWAGGVQTELQIKLLIGQFTKADQVQPQVTFNNDFMYHTYLNRLDDKPLVEASGAGNVYNAMLSGVKQLFFTAFPFSGQKIHKNIPPIVGIFKDNSPSTFGSYHNLVEDFTSFYKTHSYVSGVTKLLASGPINASGYVKASGGQSETWYDAAESILNSTLSSGNLIVNDALNFITSGVGQEWAQQNAYEFQSPPGSGGRVYIFENESGVFNLVQEIKSPNDSDFGYGTKYNDRFGHAVGISENCEVVAIGSPYSTACRIFERDEDETPRMYAQVRNWLIYTERQNQTANFDQMEELYGVEYAQRVTYHNLTAGDKFAFRTDRNFWSTRGGIIEPYRNVFNYSYGDIEYIGSLRFIAEAFAPTSRLGYSCAVSDDGDRVVFGAPTDSFNEFDDLNAYYNNEEYNWPNSVNAGAVRVFESRRYYPHDTAVEYYKFGNLDMNTHLDLKASGYYDQLGTIFGADDVPFERTDFSDLEIPVEAGLAFIITPEVDAASDEIIQNIKDWLALGDRTLVLVGNDPVWEEDGLYHDSNAVINRILEGLGSRMKLYPARNEQESLPDCVPEEDVASGIWNITAAYQPQFSHGSYIPQRNMFAKGVGDIRINLTSYGSEFSTFNQEQPCYSEIYPDCPEPNPYCQMPLKNAGDLRAEFYEVACWDSEQDCPGYLPANWATRHGTAAGMGFGTCRFPTQSQGGSPPPFGWRTDEEPIPLLTAGEWIPASSYIVPATSGYLTSYIPQYGTPLPAIITDFADEHGEMLFNITEENDESVPSGIFDSFFIGTFIDPEISYERDSLLQAIPTTTTVPDLSPNQLVDKSIVVLKEPWGDSEVYLIANLLAENETSLGYEPDTNSPNNDKNLHFFNNLVMKDCNDNGLVAQLGGWTGRTSFRDAYSQSRLDAAFNAFNQDYIENAEFNSIPDSVNTVWIANPSGLPDEDETQVIRDWLETGNKKLVITYGYDEQIAENVAYICEQLGVQSRPAYSDCQDRYLTATTERVADQRVWGDTSTSGCADGYSWNNQFGIPLNSTKFSTAFSGDKLTFLRDNESLESDEAVDAYEFFPLVPGSGASAIVWFIPEVAETGCQVSSQFTFSSSGNIKFPIIPGSGYRVFFNTMADGVAEYYPIQVTTNAVISNANYMDSSGSMAIVLTPPGSLYVPGQQHFDFFTPSGLTQLELTLRCVSSGIPADSMPKSVRLLSVSGCVLPLVTTINPGNPVLTGYLPSSTYWEIPGNVVNTPATFRPVMTDGTKYCTSEVCSVGTLIEDGPVVVAEEFENFSTFPAGYQRSRIVLISDSSMIQGQCPHYRSNTNGANHAFIRSLYPASPESFVDISNINSLDGSRAGRQFEFTQKLVAPDRGSPGKYWASSAIQAKPISSLLIRKFFSDNLLIGASPEPMSTFSSLESGINPLTYVREEEPLSEVDRQEMIDDFHSDIVDIGFYPKFSGLKTTFGIPSGARLPSYPQNSTPVFMTDANIMGGIPDIIKFTGKDYLDFDSWASGYRGDLFGYSVDIHNNKIVVGAPYNAFSGGPIGWEDGGSGQMYLSGNGGAGAAFYWERTGSGVNAERENLPWEFKQKIRPTCLNIGIDDATTAVMYELGGAGYENLDSSFVLENARRTDQFGYSVSMDADFLAVGTPGHDYNTVHRHIYSGSAFVRKDFTNALAIPQHLFYDVGCSGARGYNDVDDCYCVSGLAILNAGAVYTFEHRVIDWPNRTKEWRFAEKLVAQGYNSRHEVTLSGCENDNFGRSVSIDRVRRGDSDYGLAVGAPHHKFASSGNHVSSGNLYNAGAAYTYDAMIREQEPDIPTSGNWIRATVFGDSNKQVTLYAEQNQTGDQLTYRASGIIFANPSGNIFLEASGIDSSPRGFVAHRPYVESVIGTLYPMLSTDGTLFLLTSGLPVDMANAMNLVLSGAASADVYNNLNLFTQSAHIFSDSGFNLVAYNPSGTPFSGVLNLVVSGLDYSTNSLNLRTRGK